MNERDLERARLLDKYPKHKIHVYELGEDSPEASLARENRQMRNYRANAKNNSSRNVLRHGKYVTKAEPKR